MRQKTKRNGKTLSKLLILSKESDEVLNLSTIQKSGIRKGLKDIEEERTLSHSTAKKEVAKWFSICV